jgi:hypothetical protein
MVSEVIGLTMALLSMLLLITIQQRNGCEAGKVRILVVVEAELCFSSSLQRELTFLVP